MLVKLARTWINVQIAKSIQSRGRLQDVMRIFIGRPLDLPMSALIQKASFGRPMDIPWIWISCGYLMDNPQDVQWIENAIWVIVSTSKQKVRDRHSKDYVVMLYTIWIPV